MRAASNLRHLVRRVIEKPQNREPAARASIAMLRDMIDNKAYDDAIQLAEQLLAAYPADREVMRQARAAFSKAGALTLLLNALQQERRVRDSRWLAERAAHIQGRLRETAPDWTPSVADAGEVPQPASPDRVLHLLKVAAPHRQSGYTMRAKYTLEGQRAAGIEPVAMTYLGSPRSIGVVDAPADDEINGVRYTTLDVDPDYDFGKPYDELLEDFVSAAAPRVREIAPAVIHAHSGFRGYDLAHVGLALGRHFDLPVVYEVRGFFESLWTSDSAWAERSETYRRRYDTETRCMKAADAVVTLSQSMRGEIVARGVPADRVFVVPNGVDTEFFHPRPRRQDLVDRHNLNGEFVFGYVSNLDHYREGQELLVDAAVHLRDQGIHARAMIVGDGKRREHLERYTRESGAADIVTFTGKVGHDEVRDYYALLDVFVIPRVSERAAKLVTPLKPFEAMAFGVPLVTSDLAALREITGDGVRGRYFAAGDATRLANVLAELSDDEAGRQVLAEQARAWVVAERQWIANGHRYVDIYKQLR